MWLHSVRSATNGSTFAARRAGIQQANNAIATNSTATRYLNGEDGNPKFAAGYAIRNLSPMYQDEYKAWTAGADRQTRNVA